MPYYQNLGCKEGDFPNAENIIRLFEFTNVSYIN